MPLEDIMSKIRNWDNTCARWMMRHFYFVFFEFVLVAVFFTFFFNFLRTFDVGANIPPGSVTDQLLYHQLANSHLIVGLMILNSFWMLFMFNGINRLRLLLRDINYNLMRCKK